MGEVGQQSQLPMSAHVNHVLSSPPGTGYEYTLPVDQGRLNPVWTTNGQPPTPSTTPVFLQSSGGPTASFVTTATPQTHTSAPPTARQYFLVSNATGEATAGPPPQPQATTAPARLVPAEYITQGQFFTTAPAPATNTQTLTWIPLDRNTLIPVQSSGGQLVAVPASWVTAPPGSPQAAHATFTTGNNAAAVGGPTQQTTLLHACGGPTSPHPTVVNGTAMPGHGLQTVHAPHATSTPMMATYTAAQQGQTLPQQPTSSPSTFIDRSRDRRAQSAPRVEPDYGDPRLAAIFSSALPRPLQGFFGVRGFVCEEPIGHREVPGASVIPSIPPLALPTLKWARPPAKKPTPTLILHVA